MKTLVLCAAAAMLLPFAALAQEAPAAAPPALPKCTAKVQDSCDQSKTTEKYALDHYPADKRDAGNNKIGAPAAMPRSAHRRAARHPVVKTTTTQTTVTTPAQ
ncbi:hypothetical protein [Glacieibacterium sp.]|uniref:hypothetical protein n=1 Tax=Glacieibacterium sp. TaxID=2860237 RepID=UPI003AFFDAC3